MSNLQFMQSDDISTTKSFIKDFSKGTKKGMPIALGYFPVAFTFGLMAVNGGIPVWIAILISMTNLTSAGQFAGATLIIGNAPLLEITLTTFIVNIRYLLMSLSLSQKIAEGIPILRRAIMSFGITDETFAVASLEREKITFPYMMGLVTTPYWGWVLGTACGAIFTTFLPETLQSSMGIALYGMFIALLVPGMKESKAVVAVVLVAVTVSSLFYFLPYLSKISAGWVIIIATVIGSSAGALLFPREKDNT